VPVNGNGETDVNVIPPALIESVDIVTGGASAVYGSHHRDEGTTGGGQSE